MAITANNSSTVRARITSQGQISVPKAIRDHLAAGPGDDLDFEPRPDGSAIVRLRARHSILELAGIAAADAGHIPDSVKEMKRVIAIGIADAVAAKSEKIARQRKR